MRVLSYNTLFGGFDGQDNRRHQLQMDIIRAQSPDILMLQEVRPFLAQGGQILHATETELGMRGFVAESPVTGQHTAVFIKAGITPISFEADPVHFHHAISTLRMRVAGFALPITAVSSHLCPNSPQLRLREAGYLFNLADPESLTIVAGDFNSVSPDDPEPDGLAALPARYRMRYTRSDGLADRSTIAELLRSGFQDVARRHEDAPTPTVPGEQFPNTEFVPFRSDYILATSALASLSRGYGVVRNSVTGRCVGSLSRLGRLPKRHLMTIIPILGIYTAPIVVALLLVILPKTHE